MPDKPVARRLRLRLRPGRTCPESGSRVPGQPGNRAAGRPERKAATELGAELWDTVSLYFFLEIHLVFKAEV